ncbi:MAG: (E)-4-hydroxy-3-methylbut-2-enyl-diphosphate synthase [Bacteroidales bacterium]|nr:(E)-4-hydroxy-3-methylbut-2-enyl-diphosphate synthase [Bacteroidales bacterium]
MKKYICNVKGVKIGGGEIMPQSMCNSRTSDVAASVAQAVALHNAGARLIRLTTPAMRDVEALKEIKRQLLEIGIDTPLVADVHFSSDIAIAAASVADKVRINPGNFAKSHEVAMSRFKELIAICKENGTAIRIGLNHGSLSERITSLYGDTPKGMVMAVMEWLRVCVEEDFYNVTVSLKASNTKVMVDACRLLHSNMAEEFGAVFPMHLGVTEAGNADSGRIKSTVGIYTLLKEGIGDTIRVSLTENPVAELPVAKQLIEIAKNGIDTLDSDTMEQFIVKGSAMYGPDLLDHKKDDFELPEVNVGGKILDKETAAAFKSDLMQACRRRFDHPEYIACPSCGRTMYDIETVLGEIKNATSSFAGVKIAVMGCIVNGPGEMADADFGYVGEGGGKITLYKGKEPVMRGIPQQEAVEKLVELMNQSYGKNN